MGIKISEEELPANNFDPPLVITFTRRDDGLWESSEVSNGISRARKYLLIFDYIHGILREVTGNPPGQFDHTHSLDETRTIVDHMCSLRALQVAQIVLENGIRSFGALADLEEALAEFVGNLDTLGDGDGQFPR